MEIREKFDKPLPHNPGTCVPYLKLDGVQIIERDFETIKAAAEFIKMPLDRFLAMKLSFMASDIRHWPK